MVAKHILAFGGVGCVFLRPVVVQGAEEGNAGVVRAARLRVDIRLQCIAKLECRAQDRRVRLWIGPDASLRIGILGGVGAQNGAERAKLHPACVEFRLYGARRVPADVVTPVGITYVGRGGREPRLEGQRIPH